MAIERLNKTFVDGEVWDSTDINPITSKIDECIDQINLNTDEINNLAYLKEFLGIYYGAYAEDPETDPNGDPPDAGDYYWNTTRNVHRVYNGDSWKDALSSANNVSYDNTSSGLSAKNVQEAIDEIISYKLPIPSVSTTDIYENGSGTHMITNYDPEATYEIVSHDSLITDITIENDKIHITAGDITDDQDHAVSYILRIGRGGYLYNETTVNFTIKYLNLTSDDAIIVEDSTYTEDSFETIYNGVLVA